jgi:general secretion pathway protein D
MYFNKGKRMPIIFRYIFVCLVASVIALPAQLRADAPDEGPVVERLMVRGLTVRQFAELLTRSCDLSVVASRGAADITIDTYLQNLPAEDLLRSICRAYGLWYRVQPGGLYEILTMEEFRSSARIYQEDFVEVIDILYPAAADVGIVLHALYPDRVVWSRPGERFGDRSEDISSALNRMDQITERAQFALDGAEGRRPDSQTDDRFSRRDSRFDTRSSVYGRREQDFTRQGPDQEEQRQIRERMLQRLQAEDLLRLTEADEESVWDVSGETGFVYISAFPGPNRLVLRSSDQRALEQIKHIVQALDTVTPQVLLEVKVLEISLSDSRATGVDWLFQDEMNGGQGSGSGAFSQGLPGSVRGNEILGAGPNLLPQGTGIDPRAFVFSYISESLRARVQLLETQNRIVTLASPTLTVADEEASTIFIGEETTIPISVNTIARYNADGVFVATESDLVTERRNVGDTLLVIPKLHADRTVTLRMLHENSQPGESKVIAYGQRGENVLNTQNIARRTAASTVVAGDGDIVALGGLIRERVVREREGIPFLQRIPLMGTLFRREVERRERSELVVLIVPHILVAPGEAGSASREYLHRASLHPSAHEPVPSLNLFEQDEYLREAGQGQPVSED